MAQLINVTVVSALGDGLRHTYPCAEGTTVGQIVKTALGNDISLADHGLAVGTSQSSPNKILKNNDLVTVTPKKVSVG